MSPEANRRRHPDWAERERLNDLAWIGENMFAFWDVAQQGYVQFGRGAIAVDTTVQPDAVKGNPLFYLTQELIPEMPFCGADEIRMVASYDPTWQFVTILVKQENRVSTYRVGVPGQLRQPGSEETGKR
jgi:hypothetical protein